MRNNLLAIILLAGLATLPIAATAQDAIAGRVDRLEREMRAVQRKVFPGGAGQTFAPQINGPESNGTLAPGTPATSVVTDLGTRLNALESQLTTLTGQVEQNQFKLRTIEDALNAHRRTTDARLKALEDGAASTTAIGALPLPATTRPAVPATATSTATKPKPDTASVINTSQARAKLIAAVEKPSTDDGAEDGYVYGFRLWQAKLYPEAEVQLKQVVAKYPTHRRASWAQNLLGRTYLDDGKPSLASLAFYDNYKKFHDGERAPDSLYFLSVALKKLGKPSADICKVYDELSEVYADRIAAPMKADIARGRATEKCKTS